MKASSAMRDNRAGCVSDFSSSRTSSSSLIPGLLLHQWKEGERIGFRRRHHGFSGGSSAPSVCSTSSTSGETSGAGEDTGLGTDGATAGVATGKRTLAPVVAVALTRNPNKTIGTPASMIDDRITAASANPRPRSRPSLRLILTSATRPRTNGVPRSRRKKGTSKRKPIAITIPPFLHTRFAVAGPLCRQRREV